ncbi:14221_t:CDS:1, partial [Racocetra persica]
RNKKNGLDEDSKILLNRLRNVEKDTRLGDERIGVVSKEIMLKVKISVGFGGLVSNSYIQTGNLKNLN